MASRVWRDGTRRGIAYVEDREAAQQVMEIAGRRAPGPGPGAGPRDGKTKGRPVARPAADAPLDGAMAVYLDRRGRPFAWQIPFDIGHWDRVAALVGTE
jgi:hypothetical protein